MFGYVDIWMEGMNDRTQRLKVKAIGVSQF